jgi:uncharacterized membrane protein YccC
LSDVYSADFVGFANGNIAILLGMWSGAIATALVRSVGTRWSAERLVRRNWSSLVDVSRTRPGRGPRALAVLMLDRIGLLVPKLEQMREGENEASRLLAEVNVGAAVEMLRDIDFGTADRLRRAVRDLRDAIGARYREQDPGPDAVLPRIDRILSLCLAHPHDVACRRTLSSLLEIRRGLFPASWPPDVLFDQQEQHL